MFHEKTEFDASEDKRLLVCEQFNFFLYCLRKKLIILKIIICTIIVQEYSLAAGLSGAALLVLASANVEREAVFTDDLVVALKARSLLVNQQP